MRNHIRSCVQYLEFTEFPPCGLDSYHYTYKFIVQFIYPRTLLTILNSSVSKVEQILSSPFFLDIIIFEMFINDNSFLLDLKILAFNFFNQNNLNQTVHIPIRISNLLEEESNILDLFITSNLPLSTTIL